MYVAVPVIAVLVGGVVAAFRPLGPRVTSYVQHFAAGVVFAAVAGELLPEVTTEDRPVSTVVGFAIGVGLMLAVRQITKAKEGGPQDAESSTGLVATVGVDIAVDGLLIGIAFAAGAKTGVLVMVALTLELLFLGLATAAAMGRIGASRVRVIGTTVGLSVVLAVAAVLGVVLLGGLSGAALEATLAFGAAALLYLVTEELLVEAHEVPETPTTTALFFLGFIALFVIEMVA